MICERGGIQLIEKENQKENQKTTPKVEKLEDLIAYQKGSVVSREIIRKSTGTATIFAFDLGQGLSEHTAPFDALVHIIDGQAEITISGKAYNLARGDFIILPAGEPHSLKATSRFKMLLVMIRS
ncbi:cupin domain-containing protein [Methanothrix sp.]|uniref:cupin domain-containing protein n=1 Tax=Methanothrix sp. TaxID=90426 RepID=UPI001BD5537F